MFLLLVVLLCSIAGTTSERHSKKDSVTLCQVPIPSELQDAQFVVTYRFETDRTGKLKNITKVKNDFLKDDAFIACMSNWSLPSVSGEGTADFFHKAAEGGWTEINVIGKGFNRSFPYH
jgi:hypothetical protein